MSGEKRIEEVAANYLRLVDADDVTWGSAHRSALRTGSVWTAAIWAQGYPLFGGPPRYRYNLAKDEAAAWLLKEAR